MKKNISIKLKILTVPLTIMFIVIAIIATVAITIARGKIIGQMQNDGANMANQLASEFGKNSAAIDTLNESIDTRIKTLGNFIVTNSNSVNNEYLLAIAKQFEVDEINIVDSSGKIVYSNLQPNIGFVFDDKHISNSVLKNEKGELMEAIRKSSVGDNYYKYGYIANQNGGMVQIGVLANKVQKLSENLQLQTLIQDLTKDKNIVYALFIDKNLKAVAHSEKDRIGISLNDEGSKKAAVEGKTHSSTFLYKDKVKVYDVLVPVYKNGAHIGAIDIGLSLENVTKTVYNTVMLISAIALAAFIISSLIMMKISRGIIDPLLKLVQVSKKISEGDFDNEISIQSNDEIGVLALSFRNMSDSLKKTMGMIKMQSANVNDMAQSLNMNAEHMSGAASEVAGAIQEVTKGAEEQANALVEVANHMSSLSDELENIERKISIVKESSDATGDKAAAGKDQIDILLKSIQDIKLSFEMVVDKVNSLNTSVSKVGNITEVINGISEQTNLLALNAAIEAARAGESGKGFAVVAEEVRRLAEQSKGSTEEIQRLIYSISSETGEVITTSNDVKSLVENQVNIVKNTIISFDDMIKAVSNITPLVNDSYVSLEKTMKSKELVLSKIEEVTSVAEETSAASEEISASSQEMMASTEEVSKFTFKLNDVVKQLNDETDKFNI
ncbi:methyl-accepting chemotaxis protein [Clostridium sp. CX1]|uniref:methyl-accepting chemotaxis protein n=1 Tax=Clostridium sp. CX1 TaxID=2978346 RepID=UPI0021C20F96|nr:methyl-accepting chemotaxis protein [Clostridium sp. CX1]MCT8978116.1 methyl-accepting chemotaxis protein [Clostridium sp. CX1]